MVAAIAAIVSVKTNVSMVDAMLRAAAVAAAPARVAARMSSTRALWLPLLSRHLKQL
jgi:hypothetical protein